MSARSSIGRQPCSSRHSWISRGCSSAWMWSGSSSLARVARRSPRARRASRRGRSGGRPRRRCRQRAATRPRRGRRDAGLAHAVEAAALVGDVEQHDRDPGSRCRLGGRERLRRAEVVELAHGGVPGGAHLAIDVCVVAPDRIRASRGRLPRASRRATSRSRCRRPGRAGRAGTRGCGC